MNNGIVVHPIIISHEYGKEHYVEFPRKRKRNPDNWDTMSDLWYCCYIKCGRGRKKNLGQYHFNLDLKSCTTVKEKKGWEYWKGISQRLQAQNNDSYAC